MRTIMRYCTDCKRYTLSETCPVCGGEVRVPIPPRFSPEDRYGKYRRKLKELEGMVKAYE